LEKRRKKYNSRPFRHFEVFERHRRLAVDFAQPECGTLRSATDAISLPQPKPRAMRERFVVPSIRSRDVAWAEWPYIRRFEHFL
jgi:hypothetical protein